MDNVDGVKDTLEHLARVNDSTPMALFALFRGQPTVAPVPAGPVAALTPQEVKDRHNGTGLGRKTLKFGARPMKRPRRGRAS